MRTVIALGCIALTGTLTALAKRGSGECPSNSAAQAEAGRAVVKDECQRCHSPNGFNSEASEQYDLSDIATVRDAKEDMYSEAEEGSMPEDKKLTAAQLESLRVYLACGAPD